MLRHYTRIGEMENLYGTKEEFERMQMKGRLRLRRGSNQRRKPSLTIEVGGGIVLGAHPSSSEQRPLRDNERSLINILLDRAPDDKPTDTEKIGAKFVAIGRRSAEAPDRPSRVTPKEAKRARKEGVGSGGEDGVYFKRDKQTPTPSREEKRRMVGLPLEMLEKEVSGFCSFIMFFFVLSFLSFFRVCLLWSIKMKTLSFAH